MALTRWKCSMNRQLIYIGAIYFLYKAGESMLDTVVRPYLLQIVCNRQSFNNKTECVGLGHLADGLDSVQKETSFYFIIYRLAANVPAIISSLYFGAWSDKHGCRLPMVLSCIGAMLAVVIYIGSIYLNDGTYKIWLVLSGSMFQGIFGKGAVFSMAVNCFIAIYSEGRSVTENTGLIFSMSFFGQCFGAFIAGIMGSNLFASYLIVIGIQLMTILIILLLVQEINHLNETPTRQKSELQKRRAYNCDTKTEIPERNSKDIPVSHYKKGKEDQLSSKHYLSIKERGHCKKFAEQNNQRHKCFHFCGDIKPHIAVVFRRRSHASRYMIATILFITFIHGCDVSGQVDIFLLFVTRSPFNWSNARYSFFISMENVSIGLALVLILPLLSKFLELSDSTFIMIGITCKICRYMCTGVSNESWMLYLLVPVWAASSFFICVRSILCKCAEEDELGKIFSVYSSVDTTSYIVGKVMYISIYGGIVALYPGVTFFIMGISNISIVLIFVLMYKNFGKLEGREQFPVLVQTKSGVR